MIGQSRRHSVFESIANVLVGFGIAAAANFVVMPWFGYNVTVHDSMGIGGVLTVVSIVRSYALRRFFNWFHIRKYRTVC